MEMGNCNAVVSNMPRKTEKFVVARVVDTRLWYWGSWDNEPQAREIAKIIDGVVLKRTD